MRKAAAGEASGLAETLARAFLDDPIVGWILPDEPSRKDPTRQAFDLFLRRVLLRHDETYSVADTSGVCVWEPPGTWKLEARQQLSLLPSLLRIYGRRLPHLLKVFAVSEKHHPTEPHYYLAFLGVEPKSQGRGLGSMLMHPILERCDSEGIPAYLEASSLRSRALYERHGFTVTKELKFWRSCPPMWAMWRDPR